jgi:2-polyprenyl-3-methyl-5-hydroxy-6-metoxy-1,4-benzoquinol methylase
MQLRGKVGSAAGRRARILDVGCGAGGLARLLERSGFEVVGLDTSERMIVLANPDLLT